MNQAKKIMLASVCMTSGSDKEKNVRGAIEWVKTAAAKGADWVLLPEVFTYIGPYDAIYANGEVDNGPLVQTLSKLARDLNIVLFAGSFGERPGSSEKLSESLEGRTGFKRVFNTSYVFGRDGKTIGKYRKTHPFNLMDNEGKPLYCESDGFMSGDTLVTLDVEGYHVGLAICYDLRFPRLFERLAKDQALDVILLPSAFTTQTGMDHWEVLLRARAIEQQAYVYASNQVGESSPGKSCYGHSMIIDPWGYVLANTGGTQGIAMAEMSLERIAAVRGRLPALKNRRPEVYE
ncbi:MAG: carbon-nitrogen hydrolase family protein [Chitinophagaceae bacterium]|nr:carbon-nitrogen hydrolase family protein [Oligoflexus sp.]